MQGLRVTLYEIFGYFAPGAIAIFGFAIALWSIYFPATAITSDVLKIRPVLFVCLGFAAYIVGHLLQAIGNLHCRAEKRKKLCTDCQNLTTTAMDSLANNYRIRSNCYSLSDITAVAFAIMSQNGKTDAYEVFVYREGFYRAGYLSFAFLAISSVLRTIHPAFISLHDATFALPASSFIAFFVLCALTSFLFFLRFRRFGEYRVKHVLSVISISPMAPLKETSDVKD